MKTILLGSSDLKVPQVAVGCMRIKEMTAGEADSFVKGAVELGADFFDHADIYGGGGCEELFGNVLKDNPGMREKILIQSKAGIVPGKMYDNSKEYLVNAVDGILKRLHTEYLDVFLIHRPDALADPEDTAEGLESLVRSGKVRYFGVSNHRTERLALLDGYLKEHQVMVNQLQFSLAHASMIQSGMEANMLTDGALDRDGGLLDYCRLHRITIQTWSPFQYGFFKGSFIDSPEYPKLNRVLLELAEKYNTTKTAVASAWILCHPAKMQLISGSTRLERLKEICYGTEINLTREEWYRLYLAAGHMLP